MVNCFAIVLTGCLANADRLASPGDLCSPAELVMLCSCAFCSFCALSVPRSSSNTDHKVQQDQSAILEYDMRTCEDLSVCLCMKIGYTCIDRHTQH